MLRRIRIDRFPLEPFEPERIGRTGYNKTMTLAEVLPRNYRAPWLEY